MMRCLLLLFIGSIAFLSAHKSFQAKIPNGDKVIHMGAPWPGVGHFNREGAGLRNPFGEDFQKNNYQWTKSLCLLDSDGDGYTNGFELGDPECKWVAGQTPDRIDNITHPGFPPNISGMYDPDCFRQIEDAKTVSLTYRDFKVPSKETSYICKNFNLPSDKKYYAKSFSPVITSPEVHHMIVYVCKDPVEVDYDDCANMKAGCAEMLFAWAIGGGNFCLPMNVSLPMGKGEAQHVILQIHYDNPTKAEHVVDNSGVLITYSDVPQQHEAAYIRMGVEMKFIDIPPGNPSFEIVGQCLEDKTSYLTHDITVFGSLLHMHKLGRKIWTDQFRGGSVIGDMGRKDTYDFNLQTYIKFKDSKSIKKNDRLITHCVYDSTSQTDHVGGGEASNSEMCFNFIVYYPRLPGVYSCTEEKLKSADILAIVVVSILVLLVLIALGIFVRKIIIKRREKQKYQFV